MKKGLIILSALMLVVGATGIVKADPITFTGSSGNLAASATFEVDIFGNMIVTLTNTSTADVLAPADVLTAVFFTMSGISSTPVSALLKAGSTVFYGSDGGGNVGGEWAYASGLAGAPRGATEGISSSGFDLFGAGNFNGSNLQGPDAVDGVQYGIVSAGDNLASGNAKVTGGVPLIQNSVVFTLSRNGGYDSSTGLSNVSFQYGTNLCEPNINIPEPTTLLLLGAGLLGIGMIGRRMRRS